LEDREIYIDGTQVRCLRSLISVSSLEMRSMLSWLIVEDLEGLTHMSTLCSMTVLACKACDDVATAILSDLTFLK
jgi:hypothetical protein